MAEIDGTISNMSVMSGFTENMGDQQQTPQSVRATTNGDYQTTYTQKPASVSTSGGSRKAPDFKTRLIAAQSARALSADGDQYFKTLVEESEKNGYKYERLPRTNAYLFHDNQNGVAIVFAEHIAASNTNIEYTPISKQNDRVIEEAAELYEKIPVLDVYLVTKEDYSRAKNMSDQIDRVLKYGLKDVVRYEDLSDKTVFRLSSNLYQIKNYIDQLSPNGVQPHIQFGVAVEMCTSEDYNPRRDENQYTWVPFVVIGAYVEFSIKERVRKGEPRIQPIIHISTIVSPVPSMYVFPIAVSAAYQTFIGQDLWKDVFTDFSGRQPNLGSLIINPETNRPAMLESIRQRDVFISNECYDPILMIDIQDGRANIPGMRLFINKEGRVTAKNILADFFSDSSVTKELRDIVIDACEEYTGIVNDNGTIKDSRSIDYFRVVENTQNLDFLSNFVNHSNRPEDRMRDIFDAGFTELQSYYSNWMCVFDPDDLILIADRVGVSFTPIMGDMNSRSMLGFNFSPNLGERFRSPFVNGGSVLRPGNRSYSSGRRVYDVSNVFSSGFRRY